MRIEWDAALVAATARAMDARWRGARIRAVILDPEARRFTVYLREATWVFLLHPEESGFRVLDPGEPPPEARPLPAKVRAVRAPSDDRILIIEALRVRGSPSRVDLILELMTNQENVLWAEGEERTIRVLLRTREGRDRTLRRGHAWTPPPPSDRRGIEGPIPDELWDEVLRAEGTKERRRAILRNVAWSSPLLADAVVESGDVDEARSLLERVRRRVEPRDEEVDEPEAHPGWVLAGRKGPQPWPLPLPDRVLERARGLLEAFERAAEREDAALPTLLPRTLLDRLEQRVERMRGRLASLEEERSGLGDPDVERARGDLLLARFHEIESGATSVTLIDFEGNEVTLELDPKLAVNENARRFYDRAARIERAADRLPRLIEESRRAWEQAESLLERARAGEADRAEIDAVLPELDDDGGSDDGPSLPYRRFRSSNGHEIRVGRGAARNDDLTFHHSAPNDVWLHARHSAGAHVILRWGRDETPPQRDLLEAAVLAALHSKARTSGSVPVDWTFRKYVRKPRKAPPGAVVPDRVKTLFVEPLEEFERKLRVD